MKNILLRVVNDQLPKCLSYSSVKPAKTQLKYPTKKKNIMDKETKSHPYRKVHHWQSKKEFCKDMLKQVIYNKDGLVGFNKPYGISARTNGSETVKKPSGIPYEVDYTLMDILPDLTKILGYESLRIIRTPEKFTSGVVLLGIDEKIENAVVKSLRRAEGSRIIPKTYWIVTRRVPAMKEGEKRVAMKLKTAPDIKRPVPVIIDTWGKNEQHRGDVKILNTQFKILSNGTYNLASLVELKSSTTQWHAIRLFAASILLSPVLGDRVYGSRSQSVMDKWVAVNPLVSAASVPPKLDKDLLKMIKVLPYHDTVIPAHIHLREMFLPSFITKENDVTITAPLYPYFIWTCRQLEFNEKIIENGSTLQVIENNNEEKLI